MQFHPAANRRPLLPVTQSGRALPIVIAVVLGLLTGLALTRILFPPGPEFRAASIYPEARTLAPFELETADGEAFTEDDLAGRPSLLFFGFTHCPDVCPTTLSTLAAAMDKLDAMRVDRKPRVVFVSVDPARDAGEAMQAYAESFDPEFTAVTGDDEALQQLTSQVGAMYARNPPDTGGFYTVDHSTMLVIVDSRGRMIGRFGQPFSAEDLAADLFTLVRAGV
ncbi:MAG: SCO family protein [Wenzhouxiangellaceae bacterium]|nr:SCO family protein [Wenzhouxiangellaceae bacterium]